MLTTNHLSTPALLTGLFLSCAPLLSFAQEDPTTNSAKEHNPGYFHGGLNYSLNTVVPEPGFILGLGSEFYFGGYVAERLRFGLNMGWFSIAGNFGDNGRVTGELQAIKPGFLFSADLSESTTLTFKYSAMPTGNVTTDLDGNDNRGDYSRWGVTHGPYFGMSYKKFMAGFEYVAGSLVTQVDGGSIIRADNFSSSASTFRFMIGVNY